MDGYDAEEPAEGLFRSQCVAYTAVDDHLFRLGSQPLNTAWLAFGWLARRATHIAEQIDSGSARPVRAWLADSGEHTRAVEQVTGGAPYTFTICGGPLRFVLTVTPSGSKGEQCHTA